MSQRTVKEIASACGGDILCGKPDTRIGRIVTNHLDVTPNCGFVAIKGKRSDGNDFAPEAIRNGCRLIITEKELTYKGAAVIRVRNVYIAIERLAVYLRESELKTLIGVTGSVGKTTVRELLASILSQRESVLSTRDNRNNLLGLCFTLLENDGAKTAVCELGISEKGEMSALSRISTPDLAIITNVGYMHTETLGSAEDIAREKLKITEFMRYGGSVITNADEPLLSGCGLRDQRLKTVSVLGNKSADYMLLDKKIADNGTVFDVKRKDGRVFSGLFIPLYGNGGVYDAMLALAAADTLLVGEADIRRGLSGYAPCGNRQRIKSVCGATVMLDCYNSGPVSLAEAFDVFCAVCASSGKTERILLLGSMLELGEISRECHVEVGKKACDLDPTLLITFGREAEMIARGAVEAGLSPKRVYSFFEGEEQKLGRLLKTAVTPRSAVLIKGSRRLEMERFEAYIGECEE